MQETINGTSTAKLKEVRVSEASRRDAKQLPDRQSLKKALKELDLEASVTSARKRDLEARMVELNNKYRTSGGRMPDSEYKQLCNEQCDTKQEIKKAENNLFDIQKRKLELRKDLAHCPEENRADVTNDLLRAILRELRLLNTARQ